MIKAERSMIALIDVQERLTPAMAGADELIGSVGRILQGAAVLEVPVLVSRQYPKGLGDTLPELREHLEGAATVDKVHFSCTLDDHWTAAFDAIDRPQAILIGIEAHVCVLQTALGLRAKGIETFVVADAVSSRRVDSVALALERLRQNGVQVVNREMVLFEWMQSAQHPSFKAISALIK